MNTVNRSLLIVASCVALYACAGPAPAIQHRLSMDMLQSSPPEVRAPVADAYNKHYQAQLNLAHNEFLLKDIEYELRMASAEKTMAKQKMKMEKIKSQRNELAFKVKLMDAAKSAMLGYGGRSDALTEKLRYLKAQRRYLKKAVAHAKAEVDHSEARFELAKAKLAKERKTIPKGFKLAKFTAQEKRTGKIANKRAQRLKSAQAEVKSKRGIWNRADKGNKVPKMDKASAK